MWWWHGDWSWGAWLVMTLAMALFWGLVIWGVVTVARSAGPDRQHTDEPERILAQRFARGEIDVDDYQQRLEAMRAGDGHRGASVGSRR